MGKTNPAPNAAHARKKLDEGIDLLEHATLADADEAVRLLNAAQDCFADAHDLNPNDFAALSNWGSCQVLMALRLMDAGNLADAQFLLGEAEEKYRAINSLLPERCLYNLACVAALRDDEADCRAYLDKAKAAGDLPPFPHDVLDDPSLAPMRERPWFRAFVKSLHHA